MELQPPILPKVITFIVMLDRTLELERHLGSSQQGVSSLIGQKLAVAILFGLPGDFKMEMFSEKPLDIFSVGLVPFVIGWHVR